MMFLSLLLFHALIVVLGFRVRVSVITPKSQVDVHEDGEVQWETLRLCVGTERRTLVIHSRPPIFVLKSPSQILVLQYRVSDPSATSCVHVGHGHGSSTEVLGRNEE